MDSAYDAMAWSTHALQKWVLGGVFTKLELAGLLGNRCITTGSCFSGVESAAVANASIAGAAKALIAELEFGSECCKLGRLEPPVFKKCYAIEKD